MPGHTWRFFRAGGVDQVVLSRAADLENLHALDQKLWVALACPVRGLEIDARTLELLDVDADGRIRPPEILAAITWLRDVLRDLGDVFKPADAISLDAIAADTPAGNDALTGARLVLKNLGRPDGDTISLQDVTGAETIFASTKLNGDGVVPAQSADDADTASAIADVVAVMGSVPDRSGAPGVDQAKVDAFFEQARAYAAWAEAGLALEPRPALGEAAGHAVESFDAVRAKVNDYFVRCRLAAFDTRAATALNPSEADLAVLSTTTLSAESEEVARLPLAPIAAYRPLPLAEGVNPVWSSRLSAFALAVVASFLGGAKTELTENEWETISSRLAAYRAWLAARPTTDVAKLDHARIVALAKSDAKARIDDLIARDAALAKASGQIEAVEKLVRCRRDFLRLLKNFVNFAEFYGERDSIFRAGTLYLDARSCDLCLSVEDTGRHAVLAALSQAYLAYCDCVRRAGRDKPEKERRSIVAAFTGGDTDNLMVGRNGVFYDRKGDDWDATITKIIDNPISVRQAFWAPYKRFIRLVEEQVAKRARTADEERSTSMAAGATAVAGADEPKAEEKAAPPKEEAKPEGKKIDVGTVAAIGVAVGGIATFLSSILATFFGLGLWMPFGLLALLLAISGPSMLIAWLKLRQRNVGPILDANGWAVNAKARINIPFGGALTGTPRLPPGATRSLRDPFAEKAPPWRLYVFLVVVALLGAAWFLGKFDTYLPEKARAATVLHRTPAPRPPSSVEPK